MDGHQVSLEARGGATGVGRTGASPATDQYLPTYTDTSRPLPTFPEECRTRAAHDKCHRDSAPQPSGLPEN